MPVAPLIPQFPFAFPFVQGLSVAALPCLRRLAEEALGEHEELIGQEDANPQNLGNVQSEDLKTEMVHLSQVMKKIDDEKYHTDPSSSKPLGQRPIFSTFSIVYGSSTWFALPNQTYIYPARPRPFFKCRLSNDHFL